MIKGVVKEQTFFADKPTVNYRKLDALNQSMIALFDSNPVQFFEEFKLGKKRKRKQNTSMEIGDLADFYILECRGEEEVFQNRFDENFALLEGSKGSGQVFVLADKLFDITQESLNENNEATTSFQTRFEAAVAAIQGGKEPKYKGKTVDKILEDFETNGKEYFQTRLDNINKTVVDISLVEKAKAVSNNILKDEFTARVFEESTSHLEKLTKFPIEWIYITKAGKKIVCKSEVDILQIDHDVKAIYIKDLKTTYDNESFEYSYIKNNYYLQGAFYYLAVKYWAEQEGLKDYAIVPMEFIVGDTSANNRRPIVYPTTMIDVSTGLHGFSLRGIYYRGIHELIEEISWCEDNDIWNCSKQVFDNKGVIPLNIKYD